MDLKASVEGGGLQRRSVPSTLKERMHLSSASSAFERRSNMVLYDFGVGWSKVTVSLFRVTEGIC